MEILNGQGTEVKWKTVYHLLAKNGGVKIGSRGRTRTYNPAVNSRMLYH